jgi:asparagine synthase (glutamine-hydrolysing)
MGGLAALIRRDGSAVDRSVFEALLRTMDHRGRDGRDILWREDSALGHQRFWTIPEEVGERQPLSFPGGALDLVFDGRLDNRDDLRRVLAHEPDEAGISDAALALRAYAAWGDRCFDRFLGPFAAVVFDRARRAVVGARDALGDRTLCYVLGPGALAIATEEQALLTLPWVSSRLNETTLARYFAIEGPEPGETFFAEVRELPPAHVMTFAEGGLTLRRTWEPDPEPRVRHASDGEYEEHFRSVLEESVRCRLRSRSRPAVLMSGGLDSAPVAAIAARELARSGQRLTTISYVFDELTSCDERNYMDQIVEMHGLDAIRFPGDGAWPLSNLATWPVNPNTPMEGLYRGLRDRAYAAALGAGTQTLLTGEHGDALYPGGEFWLADLLAEGRLAAAGKGLGTLLNSRGLFRRPARHALRSTLGGLARAWGWRRRNQLSSPADRPWLTPFAASLVTRGTPCPASVVTAHRPGQHAWALDPLTARGCTTELFHGAHAGVEPRWPFRDRRLVELALGLPAHQLYRPGENKRIMRRCMKGLLPESVRLRPRPTSIIELGTRGLVEREGTALTAVLAPDDAVWRRFVGADWLERALLRRSRPGWNGPDLVVPWLAILVELWNRPASLTGSLDHRYNQGLRGGDGGPGRPRRS